MDKANLGLSVKQREGVCGILNCVLADEFLLYTKTRNYHWNVTGPQFAELHRFLDEQYNALNDVVDLVAERVRALGGRSLGSLQGFLAATRLSEPDDAPRSHTNMLVDLCNDHETVIRRLREDLETCGAAYDDEGTKNFLTDLMEKHEKMAWMLRAGLVGPPATARVAKHPPRRRSHRPAPRAVVAARRA